VIEAIKQGTRSQYSSVIREIQAMIPNFTEVYFKYESRNCNRDAHNLAKYSSSLEPGRYLWLDMPPDPHVVPMIVEV
jgi:hypothetical protein